MTEELTLDPAVAQTTQIIKQVINAWKAQSNTITAFFNKYDDAVYLNEVAPGRNRAIYLLGHLVSASDGLFPLFGLGERIFPKLERLFSTNPDLTFADIPTIAELKQNWETVNIALAAHFDSMQPEEWLDKHTRVSDEDFALEPTRNKLNVLMSRTNHISNHLGQLFLLPNRK
ncbi:DinB family protein [Mucilaginibacter sp. HMF5004]|uniref:DinB family protein n=1 Tax=Mucilaginibacter rivuli TaxID=2857527 RepID=UPI001C5D9075|nr:DinB family protein [Mucilaginibacter rivuli]MBW4888557.1 DinB family protein [Mucilaginibacter rivuli]